MEKLDPKTDGSTTDIVGKNIEKLKELFHDVFTAKRKPPPLEVVYNIYKKIN